jgi:hypothetical protein
MCTVKDFARDTYEYKSIQTCPELQNGHLSPSGIHNKTCVSSTASMSASYAHAVPLHAHILVEVG